MKYLELPGLAQHNATTPDAASLDITGDMELIVKVAMDDWTPAARSTILSKSEDTGDQRSYGLFVRTDGGLRFEFSFDGTIANTFGLESSVPTGLANGQAQWIRVVFDACVGGTEATATFYLGGSGNSPVWSQLGAVVGLGFCISIFVSNAILEVGTQNDGTSLFSAGDFYVAQVVAGIGGTVVADFDANDFAAGATDGATAVDSTGKTWTIHGAGSVVVDNSPAMAAAARSPRYRTTRRVSV